MPVRGDLVSVLGQASSQFVGSSFTYGLTPSASECEFSLLGGFSCSRSLSSCWSRLAKNVTRWKAAYSLILFPPIQRHGRKEALYTEWARDCYEKPYLSSLRRESRSTFLHGLRNNALDFLFASWIALPPFFLNWWIGTGRLIQLRKLQKNT